METKWEIIMGWGSPKWGVIAQRWSPPFLAPGASFMEDNFSMDQEQGHGFRDGFKCFTFKLTSCRAAWLLTVHGPILVLSPEVREPWLNVYRVYVMSDGEVLEMGVGKKAVVHLHNRILLGHEKEETLTICNSMNELGSIMLSEIIQPEKDKYHMTSLICGT